MKKRDYTVVTRTEDGREEVHAGIKATNADIAIRRAKAVRDELEQVGVRAIKTVAAYPTD